MSDYVKEYNEHGHLLHISNYDMDEDYSTKYSYDEFGKKSVI